MGGKRQQRKRQQQHLQNIKTDQLQSTDTDQGKYLQQQQQQVGNPFAVLPPVTLTTKIFSKLSARSLCCLAAVDRFFNKSCSSEEVWERVCSYKGWKHIVNRQQGWKKGFLEYRNTICAECERRTDYVFAILKCRLCEKCEHQNPRYALATVSEARDGYGLSYAELKELPFLDRYETRLFLRSQVAERAIQLGKVLSTDAKARNIHVKTPLQKERSEAQASLQNLDSDEDIIEEGDEEEGDDDEEENFQGQGDDLTFHMDDVGEYSSSSSTSNEDQKQILAREKLKAKKEAEKVARKAHKKQVKQQNREKRAAKKDKENNNNTKLGSSPKMAGGISPPGGNSPPSGSHSKKGIRRHNSYKYSKQVWKEARRQAGHTKELPKEDTIGASPCQQRTYWLFEREDILQKWGLYDLSGLVLQTIQ